MTSKRNDATSAGPAKAVAYARVSSKEQEKEGFSIPAQQKLLEGYAQANRLNVAQSFVDIETAKHTGRVNFEEMVRYLKRHPQVRMILVEKTDRLYRNLKDWVTLDELDIEIHLVKEGIVLSRDSKSSEKFVHGIKVLMAKNYIDNLSEEARKGQQEKAEQGIWPTKAPLGYLNVAGPDGKKVIVPDPKFASLITRLFEWYASGTLSLKEAADQAHGIGLVHKRTGGRMPVSNIHAILRNRLYTGDFDWNGKRYKGRHCPLVSRELWEGVQTMLDGRGARKLRGSKREFAFSGLMTCGHCGCAMVGEIKKGRYVYYHCTGFKGKCDEPYVREEVVSKKFAEVLGRLTFGENVLAWVTKGLRESHALERREHEAAIERLQTEHGRLSNRLHAMYVDKLDGRIDRSFYVQMSEQWQVEQDEIMDKIVRHQAADRSYLDEGARIIELAHGAQKLFAKQKPAEQRRLLDFVLSNSTWKDGELTPCFRQPFDLIAETTSAIVAGDGPEGLNSVGHSSWLTMLNLAEYRRRSSSLADWLPWAGLVAPGVVLNKDGSFQRNARFRGPDLDSSTESELVAITARLNNALRRLGSGWALFVEADRRAAAPYPAASFPDPVSWLVDEERRAAFDEVGELFESAYYLTLVFLPAPEGRARAGALMLDAPERPAVDWREQLASFLEASDRVSALLDGFLPELAWLSDAETLTYLHGTISTRRHGVAVPETPAYLDAFLADEPLSGGLEPMLGAAHLRVMTVRGFPASTWPGLLDDLNRLGFPYRWTTRFLFLDKADGEKELSRLRRQWFAKRKGIMTLLRESIFQQESPLVDSDAVNKAADADAALQSLGSDQVAFGYVTATVVVWDENERFATERLKAVERVIQGRGFTTSPETLNAVEAWLSSIPGHVYANVRQPIVSTLNLAHLMPLSAVWAGPKANDHLDGPPLLITRTEGATPFRLTTHVGDVGHALVVGPTGAGKSVLLATLVLQFRKYAGSRIYVFDKGRSVRAAMLGLGGQFHDLGLEGGLTFQPLRDVDDPGARAWAAEWTQGLLAHERVDVTPEVKDAVWSALGSLGSAPLEERTLSGLATLLQSNKLRQALQPYTLDGPFGRLLDADHEDLGIGDCQAFEMEDLLHAKSVVLPVLTYLFHRLEERFDGSPTLLVLDEAWVFLDDPVFASRIREWLKTLRKKNVSVVFATQSLADIQRSAIAPAIVESCPTRIFLPSPQAVEPQLRPVYEGFGLNARQIEMIARATPKRDYYVQSRLGNRLFDLQLGAVALAFVSASSPRDHASMDAVIAEHGTDRFAEAWLRARGLAWGADLLASFFDPQTEPSP